MEKYLTGCPIDNKNLMEDAFEDNNAIFGNFYAARDHRKRNVRHLIGLQRFSPDAEGYVDAKWNYGGNTIVITLIAVPPTEDFENVKEEVFDYYKNEFSSWMCEANPALVVRFGSENDSLYVHFYFDLTKC